MTSPSVLHVCNTDEPRGAQTFARILHAALLDRYWTSHIVALSGNGSAGMEVLGSRIHDPRGWWRLRRIASRFDLVVAHGGNTLTSCATSLPGAAPFVYRQISDLRHWNSSRARRLRTRWALGRAVRVVTLADRGRPVLHGFGVPDDRIAVIPNGVDTTRFRPPSTEDRAAARRALDLTDPSEFVVLMVGVSAEKNLPAALEAVRRSGGLLLSVGELPVGLTGGGPGWRHLGPTRDVHQAMWAADALVHLSTTEYQPAAVIEAGLCGLPVVATPAGDLRSMVQPDVTGLLIEDLEPSQDEPQHSAGLLLSRLRAEPETRRRIGTQAGQLWAHRFGLHGVTEAWVQLLQSCADCRVRR